ncbi:MAG: hypothetical protein HYV26_07680 [Candidatus Hydrogenedentes bacterium]|nr:hypothetical protein [Candidatus Hydrogenedentota bacterium]
MIDQPQYPERVTFRTAELLSTSWQGFSRNFAVLFFSYLLFSLINGSIGPFLVGPLWYGLCLQSLNAARGELVTFEQFFAGFNKFLPTFAMGLLMSAACLAGFLVLIVPTCVLAYLVFDPYNRFPFILITSCGGAATLLPTVGVVLFYGPAVLFMHEYNLGMWDALEASRAMVWRNLKQWCELWAAITLLHLAGLLLCCVGAFFTTPWMIVGLAEGFRREQAALQAAKPV